MNRIITILVTIFILLLLYIWISHVWGSDKAGHPRQIVDATEAPLSDELMADGDTTISDIPAEPVVEEPVNTDEYATERKVDESVEVKSEPVKSEPVVEKKATEPKKPEPKPEPKKVTATPATTSASSEGQHLVIAGNFTQKVNAEQRVQELKKAGFPDAEVVNFDLSEYHTVCVGRFSDVNEARKLVKKLKDYHKIDAYVRIGG
jgi:cell division protein FtsN